MIILDMCGISSALGIDVREGGGGGSKGSMVIMESESII